MPKVVKFQKTVTVEKSVAFVRICIPRDKDDDDGIPADFPLLKENFLDIKVNVDNGEISGFPKDYKAKLYLKPCDSGIYALFDPEGKEIAVIDKNYVPNRALPPHDGYGDYLDLEIEDGKIMNWYREPNFSDFFEEAE